MKGTASNKVSTPVNCSLFLFIHSRNAVKAARVQRIPAALPIYFIPNLKGMEMQFIYYSQLFFELYAQFTVLMQFW